MSGWTADGRPTGVERSAAVGGVTLTEAFTYTYGTTGGAAGRVTATALNRQTGGGPWQTVQTATYAYYDGTDANGAAGDLKSVAVYDGSGVLVDTDYYRYGPQGAGTALKYALGGDAYRRLAAAVGNPLTATDAQVAQFADAAFGYDGQGRVSQQVLAGDGCSTCSGGQGAYTYTYTPNGTGPLGLNTWAMKTVETRPEGGTRTVYTNAAGQVMLQQQSLPHGRERSVTFHAYNVLGQRVLTAYTSAVAGWDDTYPDLLNKTNGNYEYLRDEQGLVEVVDWYDATTATDSAAGAASGYFAGTGLRRGEVGAGSGYVPQSHVEYIARTGSSTRYEVASEAAYPNADGTAPAVTTYAYAWSGLHPTQVTVTLPAVSAGENGPGTAATSTTTFDSFGRPVWSKDPGGFLTYAAYDTFTGAAVKVIEDADHTRTAEFAGLPGGWTTPSGGGKHLVTAAEVDTEGRVTKMTRPGGAVDYTVYLAGGREARVYAGWDATLNRPTGPTVVARADATGTYSEVLTMAAAPAVTNGRPTGAEPVSAVRSLSREYVNDAGQVVASRDYFDLTGVIYSAAAALGVQGVNYLLTESGYDQGGRPNRTKDTDGTIYRTVYDIHGRPVSEWVGDNDTPASGFWSPFNPAGMVQTAAYEYDGGLGGVIGGGGDGNLTRLTLMPGGGADDRVTAYTYDWQNRLVAINEGFEASEGETAHHPLTFLDYDNLGRVTRERVYEGYWVYVTDGDGDGVPEAPDAGLLRALTEFRHDPLGQVYETATYRVDQATGAVVTTPDLTRAWHDRRGLPVKTAVPGGLVEKVAYDGLGRPAATYQTDGGGDASWADALTVTGDTVLTQAEFGYDAAGDLIQVTTRGRFHNVPGTGALGTPTAGVRARVSYAGYYYDPAGRPTAAVDVGTNGGTAWTRPATVPARTDTVLVTTTGYDDAGLPVEVTGPDGTVDRTGYDLLGRVKSETMAHGTTDAFTTNYGYDSGGRLLTVTAPGSRVTRYGYDALGRVGSVTEQYGTALARTTAVGYDRLGNVTSVTAPAAKAGDPASVTRTAYDAVGRVVSVTEADGTALARTSSTAYDPLGRVTAVTDPRNFTTAVAYDEPARAVVTTDPQGKVWTSGYDAAGNLTADADPYGKAWTYAYDLLGRVTSAADPLTNTTRYEYTVSGDRDAVIDPRTNRTETVYDRFGRTAAVVDALGFDTQFAYDRAGRAVTVTDPRGTPTGYAYDKLGRVRTVTEAAGFAEQRSTGFTYDAEGDLVSTTSPAGVVTKYDHDAAGRVQAATTAFGLPEALTTAYQYDALDQVVTVTEPGSRVTGYAYDLLGRVESVTDPETFVTRFGYDAAGNRTWVEDAKLNKTAFAYDGLNRLKTETDPFGKTTAYGYDDAGRPVSIADRLGRVREFGYDDADRRTSETWRASAGGAVVQTQTFGYDKSGNLTSATDPDGSYAITYDQLNRAATVAAQFGVSLAFEYDTSGNRTKATDSRGGVQTSTFDRLNQLTSRRLSDPRGGVAQTGYTYTPDGQVDTVTRLTSPVQWSPGADPAGSADRVVGDFNGDGVSTHVKVTQ